MSVLYSSAHWPGHFGLFSKQGVIRSQKVTLSTFESHMSDWERFTVCVKAGWLAWILFSPSFIAFFIQSVSLTGTKSDVIIHSDFLLNSVYFQVCHGSWSGTEGLLIHRPSPNMSQRIQHWTGGGWYTKLYALYNLMFNILCSYAIIIICKSHRSNHSINNRLLSC